MKRETGNICNLLGWVTKSWEKPRRLADMGQIQWYKHYIGEENIRWAMTIKI